MALRPLAPEFTFAGFTWPRYLATLETTPFAARIAERAHRVCGPSYHAPAPNASGKGFYLNDGGMPSTRWTWADEVEGSRIGHTGWFSDQYGDAERVRGLVLRLPHGRYLAGWSMGEQMASGVDATIYTDEVEAARAADEEARVVAEAEQEREREAADEEARAEQERERDPKRQTNVEFVTELMEWGNPLKQAFIIEAITRYAKTCADADPAKFDSDMLSGAAWVEVAKEIRDACAAKYGA